MSWLTGHTPLRRRHAVARSASVARASAERERSVGQTPVAVYAVHALGAAWRRLRVRCGRRQAHAPRSQARVARQRAHVRDAPFRVVRGAPWRVPVGGPCFGHGETCVPLGVAVVRRVTRCVRASSRASPRASGADVLGRARGAHAWPRQYRCAPWAVSGSW